MAQDPGGKIAPDGRPPQAKGQGKNAKRHDLERPATPGLANSDLQQGEVSELERGQRVAPRQRQGPAQGGGGGAAPSQGVNTPSQDVNAPDAIQFLGGQQGGNFDLPLAEQGLANTKIETWAPILRELVAGPGSSGALASALINQARAMSKTRRSPAVVVDLRATDDAIEAMLNEGV